MPLSAALACGTPPSIVVPVAGDDAGLSVPPLASSSPSRAHAPPVASSSAPLEPLSPDVIIETGGVGDVRIGQPIPKRYLEDAQDPKGRYVIRWIADAQPFEAFRVGEPGRLAAFDGPFMRWGKSHAGPLEPQKFYGEALRLARGTAPVLWIVIEEKGYFTRERIGIGSLFSAVEAAYPGIEVRRDPEWFDSKPTCRAAPTQLPKVEFLLASCGKGGNGEVVRILVTR